MARLTFYPDVAFHHFHQAFGNGKTEPRAAILSSCGAIGLAEGLEEARGLIRRHSDTAVAHGKFQFDPVRHTLFELDRHYDFALFCKFHCVVYEVDQHLAKAQWIPNQNSRQVLLSGNEELQISVLSSLTDNRSQVFKHLIKVEFRVLKVQLPSLDF